MAKRDRASVHVHALRVEAELADDLKALRREGFVQFDEVEVGGLDTGAGQNLSHRGDGPDAHNAWIDPGDRARDEATERLEVELARLLLAREDESRGAVVDPARIAGRDSPGFAEGGLECRELLEAGVGARVFVAVDLADRNELVSEPAGLMGGKPALVALEREGVLILPGDRVPLRDVLARLAHGFEREHLLHARVGKAPAEGRVPRGAVPVLGLRRDERR